MQRADFNAPIESGGSAGNRAGMFLESALAAREVTRCFRWDEERNLNGTFDGVPHVYFPFTSDFAESTDGGRVWATSGGVVLNSGTVRLGGNNAFGPVSGIMTLPGESLFHIVDRTCTIRFIFGYDTPGGSVLSRVTRVLFKGSESDFGFHFINGEVPASGWGLELYQSGSSFRQLAFCFGGDPGLIVLVDITNPNPFARETARIALVHDADAELITIYWRGTGSAMTRVGTASTAGAGLLVNEAPLNASSQAQDWSGTPGPNAPNAATFVTLDEFGIWDYAWDAEQFECDVANAYTWP